MYSAKRTKRVVAENKIVSYLSYQKSKQIMKINDKKGKNVWKQHLFLEEKK